ncbi:hypothetical protein BFF78_04875 [Streptomyces fodineus]|uniref:Uncharacterized protein n=1 Tax=Streptomyces fodineus TaxID=1904616 RepID=A0A1D7Y4E5_9ACTN|nr:hypothetical protein BFF78_04875 [Streptomyces fodineus]
MAPVGADAGARIATETIPANRDTPRPAPSCRDEFRPWGGAPLTDRAKPAGRAGTAQPKAAGSSGSSTSAKRKVSSRISRTKPTAATPQALAAAAPSPMRAASRGRTRQPGSTPATADSRAQPTCITDSPPIACRASVRAYRTPDRPAASSATTVYPPNAARSRSSRANSSGIRSPRPSTPSAEGTSAPATAMTTTVVAATLWSPSQSAHHARKPSGTTPSAARPTRAPAAGRGADWVSTTGVSTRSTAPATACTQNTVSPRTEASSSLAVGSSMAGPAQATTAKWTLSARCRPRPCGCVESISAVAPAVITAAATPCTAREASSTSESTVTAAATAARLDRAKPPISTRRCPSASPSAPASTGSAAKHTLYTLGGQVSPWKGSCERTAIHGSPTVKTVVSKTTTTWAAASTPPPARRAAVRSLPRASTRFAPSSVVRPLSVDCMTAKSPRRVPHRPGHSSVRVFPAAAPVSLWSAAGRWGD